jgi:hypothetical protein
MLDGSDLREFGIEAKEGRVPVFARTGQILTDPNESVEVPEILRSRLRQEKIVLGTAASNPELQRALTEGMTTMKARINSLEDQLVNQNQGGF